MNHVLIVEDEPKIASVMQEYMEQAGYTANVIRDGQIAIDYMQKTGADLMILDLMLPGSDGLDVCKSVREFSNIPIIMVTAKIEEIDRLLGLELGADDYVCKPFSPRELVARVKANLRRTTGMNEVSDDNDRIIISVDETTHTASVGQTRLDLTPVEFRLLKALSDQPGRVWSRDELLNKMYVDYRIVSDRTVDSHINNLRKKLQATKPDEDFIRSIYGIGYKLEL